MNKFHVDSISFFILDSIIYIRSQETIENIKSSFAFVEVLGYLQWVKI